MNLSVVTSPLARAWGLLADLAAFARSTKFAETPAELADTLSEIVRGALPCPWGKLTLLESGVTHQSVWGMDPEGVEQTLHQNGAAHLDDSVELPIEHNGHSVGTLVLGLNAEARELISPSFLTALRSQIELVL